MNPNLLSLICKYQIPTSTRVIKGQENNFVWDGKTLATRQSFGDEESEYVGELYDFDLAHEIAHWVVADPIEREFPEFGCQVLGGGINFSGASDTEYRRLLKQAEGVLNKKEQDFREACADLLACYWCEQFAIPFPDEWSALRKYSQGSLYYDGSGYSQEMGWLACIWLRKQKLIT